MKRLFLIIFILIISFLIFSSVQAQTASLYLLPSTGNYTVGNIFSIEVKVNSGGIAINAAEGSLTFNTEELSVVSISKSGSIFSLWTTEPAFSNSAGTIDFGGGTPTSFSGASGTIITINFKAKRAATSNVNFISGVVLAADGKGTNVLAKMSGGTYTLKPGIVTPPAEEVPPEEYIAPPAEEVPTAPVEIEVLPIEKPEILKYQKRVRIGETLEIEGRALPEARVRIFIQREGKEPILEEVKVDSQGNWKLVYEKALAQGKYSFWAQTKDERGELSDLTQKYFFEVGLPPFLEFGKIAIDYLTTVITLIILIIGTVAVIAYTWYRISIWRKRIRKETTETEKALRKAFGFLRKRIKEQIEMLDSRPGLNEEEKKIRNNLKNALNIAEESVAKEIKDIEKELE